MRTPSSPAGLLEYMQKVSSLSACFSEITGKEVPNMKNPFKIKTPAEELLDEIRENPDMEVSPRSILLAILGYDGETVTLGQEISFCMTKMATEGQVAMFERILRKCQIESLEQDAVEDTVECDDDTDEDADEDDYAYYTKSTTAYFIPEDDEDDPEYISPMVNEEETLKSVTMEEFRERLDVMLVEGRFTLNRVWAIYRIAQYYRAKKIKKIAIIVGVTVLAVAAGAVILACINAANKDSQYDDEQPDYDWPDDEQPDYDWPDDYWSDSELVYVYSEEPDIVVHYDYDYE